MKKASNYALVSKLAIPAFWFATGAFGDRILTLPAWHNDQVVFVLHFLFIASVKKFMGCERLGYTPADRFSRKPPKSGVSRKTPQSARFSYPGPDGVFLN
jgi:hypothetical protein